jgi:hypothetical protein
MRLKLFWSLIVLGAVGLGAARTLPDADAQHDPSGTHPLIGTWSVVEEGNPTAGSGLLAFTSDGIVTVVGQTGRTGLGSWKATGSRTASGTWILPGEIEPGIVGSAVLQVTLEVVATGARFTADYDLTERTASGSVVDTSQGKVQASRISAEGFNASASPTASP